MEHILIIEDDQTTRHGFTSVLEEAGYSCESIPSGADVLDSVSVRDYAVVILPWASDPVRESFMAAVRGRFPDAVLIATTEPVERVAAFTVLEIGVQICLSKPVSPHELKRCIESALERRQLLKENAELKRQLALLQQGVELAGCLDLDPLAGMVVSVMAAEAGLERGLGLLYDEEGFLSLKGVVGLDEAAGSELAEMVIAVHQRDDLTGDIIVATDIVSKHATGIRDALILRLCGNGRTQGVVALFNNRGERLSEGGSLQGLTFLLQQSTQAIENASRLSAARNLANIDELTGLFNYRYLETALDREIKRAERYRSSLSVVFLDLDQFKDINDKHGHLVGSKVLKEVGLLIKSLVREVDTVIRYGGDEYTIILVESTNVGAARVAERIRRGVEKHCFLTDEGYDIRITASLGYACYPDDSKSYAELLDMADQAMYRGKFSGKNVVFHIRQQEQTKQGD